MNPVPDIFRRWWPQRLAGQMIGLLLGALMLAQMANFIFFMDDRRAAIRSVERTQILDRTASLIDLIGRSPSALHGQMIQAASSRKLYYWFSERSPIPAGLTHDKNTLLPRLQELLGEIEVQELRLMVPDHPETFFETDHRQTPPGAEGSTLRRQTPGTLSSRPLPDVDNPRLIISAQLQDGRWLNVGMGVTTPLSRWAFPTVISMLIIGGSICIIVVFMVRRITRPLERLTEAAELVGRGESFTPITEEGPVDIQHTIRAFNRMYERLQRFVQDRTRMLAAISHDLRTPITSLRLQTELIKDKEARIKLQETLDDMQRITESTLAFSRDEASTEVSRSVDLSALIDSLCQDLADMGMDVKFESANKSPYTCRPTSLKRALRNLIENAVTYGGLARVELTQSETEFHILINDDGPGIPEQDVERVFQPFVRLEESRNKQTGGIGLGMAIARSIVRRHGGDIHLVNAPGGGLSVTIQLPKSPLQPIPD